MALTSLIGLVLCVAGTPSSISPYAAQEAELRANYRMFTGDSSAVPLDSVVHVLTLLGAIAPATPAPASASPKTGQVTFYAAREKELRTEYVWCTGDTTAIPLDSVVRWKNNINDFVNSPRFPAWRKKYMDMTGIAKGIAVCEIFGWAQQQATFNAIEEHRMRNALGTHEEWVADSVAVARDLTMNPRSGFDFGRIPFGITRRTFTSLFKETFPGNDLEDQGNSLVTELISWGGRLYTAAYFFDKNNVYCRYELQTPTCSGDSLDGYLREEAEQISRVFRTAAGEPTRTYRIGHFDIIPDRLSLYKTWETKVHLAQIGLGMQKHRYYAKIVVTNLPLTDEARKARAQKQEKGSR